MWIKSKGIKMIINKKDIDFSNYSISAYKDLLDKIGFDYDNKILLFRIKEDALFIKPVLTYNEVFFDKIDEDVLFRDIINNSVVINNFLSVSPFVPQYKYRNALLNYKKYNKVKSF